jgi:cysteine desulfurase/selenocysteine lyase
MPTNAFRQDFPFFHDQDLVYLDNAATTQKPQTVLDAMNAYYTQYCANTHRGSHDLGNKATQEYEDARKYVAKFIGADADELVFTRGTTESINLLASTYVKENFDTVILTELEHHSNILPWQLNELYLEVIPLDEDLNIDLNVYESIVRNNPNSFVAITHISNAFGILNPVKELIRIAHKYECRVLIDGAQALAHVKIDVKELDVDFYAVSAHKAYGPTGIGALYGKRELLEKMSPYQGGGSMIDDVSFEYSTFLDPPFRFEAGTQAIAEAIGFSAALAYLHSTTGNEEHDKLLLSYAKEELKQLDGIELYTEADNVMGNISFNIKGLHHDDIGILLSKQKIMLRTGHHCALPIMKRLGIKGTVRLSFALYNTTEEIDICIKALHKAIKVLR